VHGGRPWRADLEGPLFDAARRALKAAFGKEPVITGEGGSIPVVGDFQRILGAPVLLVGFGLPGENAHAPNEWMSDENFTKGIRAIAALWDELGKNGGSARKPKAPAAKGNGNSARKTKAPPARKRGR
jgi:acetylornithine deacetylase/succinyl-diaminopimelate desuccinylase-like protein